MVEGVGWDVPIDMSRQKIVLRRRVMLQRVRPPNGQSFLARYERVSKRNLPRDVAVRNTREIGPRNRTRSKKQTGRNILGAIAKLGIKLGAKALGSTGLLKKGLGVGAKAINSDIGRKLVDEGIKQSPELYRLGTSKIRGKNLKKALEYVVANYIVKEAQKKQ